MNYKITTIIFSLISCFAVVANVQASVSCDFGSGFSVAYNGIGMPNPNRSSCELNIVNDEPGTLTVTNLVIDSTSAAFVDTGANGSDWSCVYTQQTPPPDFTGETTCVPNTPIVLNSGESVAFDMNFSFENTNSSTQSVPAYVGLTDIVLNGVARTPQEANLGGFDWNIDVIDDSVSTHEKGTVRGYIYFDDNHNDKRDKNEEGIEGVKMKLQYAGADDKFDTNDDKKYTDKTNKKGKYRFNHLAKGKYRLKIKDGQMTEFYLTAEKDVLNGKSHFSLKEGETKERDFGYDRDKDSKGNSKNNNLSYLQSGFNLSLNSIISYLVSVIK